LKAEMEKCQECGSVNRTIMVYDFSQPAIDSVNLTKEQIGIIKKVWEAIKHEFAKKEIDSITINFGIISFTIKNKKENT